MSNPSVPSVKTEVKIVLPWWTKPLVYTLLFYQWIGMPLADRDTTLRFICNHIKFKKVTVKN
jgi:hypothetical protein